jgi:hypothetical protein
MMFDDRLDKNYYLIKMTRTIEMVAAAVADKNGMAWLTDIAAEVGLSKVDVAQIARARGMRLERCDLPSQFPRAKGSEVALCSGLDIVHYVAVAA